MSSEVKWIKLRIDMFDDEKIKVIQNMPDGDALLVIWIRLLTLAGKTNDGGYLYLSENLPYTDEMLSIILGKNLSTVKMALNTFESLKMIETDVKGIYLVNFDKHQNLSRLEAIREYNKEKQKKSREKKKLQAESQTLSLTCQTCQETEEDKEEDKDIDKEKEQQQVAKKSCSCCDISEVYKCYEKEIGMLSPTVRDTFESYKDDVSTDLLIFAIKTAVKSNARRLSYIEGIIKNLIIENIHTVDDLQAKQVEKQSNRNVAKTKIEKFNSMYSHDWDLDELEALEEEKNKKDLEAIRNGKGR